MNAPDRLVRRYLDALDRALSGLPEAQRWEIVDGVTEHIRTSRAELPDDGTEAEVRTILDRLGDPELIAARAREEADLPQPAAARIPAATSWNIPDTVAVLLLSLGAFLLPVVGPIIGAVVAMFAPRWTLRQKLIAFALPVATLLALTLGTFLLQGFWSSELAFLAVWLVPLGAGVALAVPPADQPLPRRLVAAGVVITLALVLVSTRVYWPVTLWWVATPVVLVVAFCAGRFGIGEARRRAVPA